MNQLVEYLYSYNTVIIGCVFLSNKIMAVNKIIFWNLYENVFFSFCKFREFEWMWVGDFYM